MDGEDNLKIERQTQKEKRLKEGLFGYVLRPIYWFRMLGDELNWSFVWSVVIVYGINQGLSLGLSRVSIQYYMKDEQKLQPSEAQVYSGIIQIPWIVKPLWGLLTDIVPIIGYRRRPYFVFAGFLGVISMLILALHEKLHLSFALLSLMAGSAGVAIADVTIDACITENSISHPSLAGDMQSLGGVSSSIGALMGFSISGFLVHQYGPKGVFGVLCIPAGLVILVGMLLREPLVHSFTYRRVNEKFLDASKSIWTALKCRDVWKPCLYMYLSLALSLNIREGMFYWYTEAKEGPSFSQQCTLGTGAYPVPPSQYNPLDEPSPLGLRLKKSPSLLDLIQMRLSEGNASKVGTQAKKEHKGTAASGTTDKLKASNFPASFLRVGTWEYKSRYEGDLVAKCYFAKHKLVWEVLDGGLKNKIEIQWSDIMALKANYPDDGPGTLDVVLARQPLFFRETNPQPRKHTLWQATSDFTGGQASIHRHHFLQCPQGLLGKHYEKLIQCDPRLSFLSQQPEIVLESLESPYFETKMSLFDDLNESNDGEGHAFFDLADAASPSGAQSSSSKNEQDPVRGPPEHFPRETPSPSSVMHTHTIEKISSSGDEELKRLSNEDQIIPGLRSSMSMSDLVNQIENRILEHRTSNNFILSSEEEQSLEILEEINHCLFSDSQHASTSDEQSIMSRVNSLCCLLQKDPVTIQNFQVKNDNGPDVIGDKRIGEPCSLSAPAGENNAGDDFPTAEGESNNVSGRKQERGMSRKDSVGELLLNLPRIASLPQFLFNILEDFDNQAR